MKKLILFSLIFLLNHHYSFSQNWEWTKKTPVINSFHQRGVLITWNGNIYTYGSKRFEYNNPYITTDPLTDTVGSYLNCFNATGDLLFSKRWRFPFYITKIISDQSNSIYFSATFYGTQNINGITISSEGDSDGAVGKMDLNGNIVWISTFGGNKRDRCAGVTVDCTSFTVFATGSIEDSLSIDHVFKSAGEQSAFICKYDRRGFLLNHKRYDYAPGHNVWYTNMGLEISSNKNGDLYALMDHDGKFWGDPGTANIIGRYIMKLNTALDTVWSRYIIGPACYYGYSCNSLQIAASGDAYVSMNCKGKYGGNAALLRLRGSDGKITWNYPNIDGSYFDIAIDSNTVYLIGNEGANGCPCPSNNQGYNVVKIFDENNALLGETRINSSITYLTASNRHGIYISGKLEFQTCTFGPDVLIPDSTLYDPANAFWYSAGTLSKLSTLPCIAPVLSADIGSVYGHYYTLCPTDTATLTTNLSSGTFLWSDSSTTATTSTATGGNFSVINTQPNGCVSYSLPISIVVNENESSHKICIATHDKTSGRNNLLISTGDYDQSSDIEEIHFYKELDGVIMHIGSKTGSNVWAGNLFIDSTSNPGTGPISYFIKTIDSCGTISPASESHTTVLVKGGKDASGKNILRWNHYSGFPVKQYKIWRGESFATMQLYDSVVKFKTSYTDEDISSVLYYYQIEASKSPYGCYSTEENKVYFSSFSRIVNCAGLLAIRSMKPELDVYPNPAESRFTVRCTTYERCDLNVKVHNTIGEVVYSENIKGFTGEYNKMISLELYPKGIYFLTVGSENESVSKKIVLY